MVVRQNNRGIKRKDARMTRCGYFAWSLLFLIPFLGTPALVRGDESATRVLSVQKALLQARHHLENYQPGEAVKILEANLPYIDGNPSYLGRLREAYRAYITNLHFEQKSKEAEVYIRRLRILDPELAEQLAKGAKVGVTTAASISDQKKTEQQTKLEVSAVSQENIKVLPESIPLETSGDNELTLVPSVQENTTPQPKFRGKLLEEDNKIFALKDYARPEMNQSPAATNSANQALALLAQANQKFRNKVYDEACELYRQVHKVDETVLLKSKDMYAFCLLNQAVDTLNNPGSGQRPVTQVEGDVRLALSLTKNNGLSQMGEKILSRLATEKNTVSRPKIAVQHLGRSEQGWEVAETSHFRIFHRQQREFVEQVAQVAEQTRADMLRKWFGSSARAWQRKCDIFLYDNAQEYSKETGVPVYVPGHSRFESDRKTGEMVSREIHLHCDETDLLNAVLPHETTHAILAGQFGSVPVPRWVDEGVAVLTEPANKVNLHKSGVTRYRQNRELFGMKELMELDDFPSAQRISPFYAQSVSVVDYLTRQRGPLVFTQFVRDGLRDGYEMALRRHYNMQNFGELQTRWSDALMPSQNGSGLAQR